MDNHGPTMFRRLAGTTRSVGEVARGAARIACVGIASAPPLQIPRAVPALVRGGGLIPAAIRLRAATHPNRAAVIDSRGSETFAELNERVNRLANILSGEGIGSGRLALLMPNCRELLEGLGAAAKLGLSPIPINPRFHAEEVERMLEVQGCSAVVVDPQYTDRVLDYDGIVLVRGDDYESALASAPTDEPDGSGVEAPLVIHTSGTTGHPKGAERKLESSDPTSLLGFLARVPARAGDVILVPAPLFHALGFFGVGLGLGMAGTQVYLERFDPAEFLRLAEKHHANGAALVPVMLKRILDLGTAVARHDLSSLRYMVVSGSQLPPPLAAKANEMLGPVVRNLYGSTEGGWVTVATPADMETHPGTVGRPLPGIRVEIQGHEGENLPPGGVGEIVVRSNMLFAGYTEEAGGDGPARETKGTYDMGDLGRLDEDGYLYVADRKDDMVVTGGENVFPAEVERVLETAPGVSDLAVMGVADEEYGEVLVAYVVADPEADPQPDAAGLAAFCRDHLANFKVPKAIWVVDVLPYTDTGKVLRRKLREDAAARLAAATP